MKNIRMFLSSTFDPYMMKHRDLFRNELRILLEKELGQYGIPFFLYDFELGIPKHTAPQRVVRMCFQAIDRCNAFVGILGTEYGTPIRSFLKDMKELNKLKTDYPMLIDAIDSNASMLELEFCYAMSSGKKDILFFIIKEEERLRNPQLQRLVSDIQKSGYDCRESVNYVNIKQETLRWVINTFEKVTQKVKPSPLTAYVVRKTKYYVEDKQIRQIYRYLGGNSTKTLCIYGQAGSGKTVMMARLYLEQHFRGMCFVFIGCNAYTLSEAILVLLKQIYQNFGLQEDKLDATYSEREYVLLFQETIRRIASYPQKCCLLIDGIDKIHIMGMLSINEILPNKLPENLKIVVTLNSRTLISGKKTVLLLHHSVKSHELLSTMLYEEGKQAEIEHIRKNRLFEKKKEVSLEYIYVFITELLAIAKYNNLKTTLFRQTLASSSLIGIYTAFLKRMLDRFPDENTYIANMLLYLCCTENGLTEEQMDSLLGYINKDILFFVYSYLEITGESRMLIRSVDFRKAIFSTWKIRKKQIRLCRRHIVDVCYHDAEDDPVLGRELLHQLMHLQDEKLTARIMRNLQIVDSITYYDEEYAISRLKKLQGFQGYLREWSKLKVTKDNFVCMFTVVNLEIENRMLENAEGHLKEMLILLEQGKIGQNYAGNIYNHLAVLYEEQSQHQKAWRYAKESIQAGIKNQESSFRICEYKNILCRMYLNAGCYDMAFKMVVGLLDTYYNPYYEESIYRLRLKITFLNICFHQNRGKEYENEFKRLYPTLRTVFGCWHPEVVDVRITYIHYLAQKGRFRQALKQYRQMKEILQKDDRFQLKLCMVESEIYSQMGELKKEFYSLKKAGIILNGQGAKGTFAAIPWYEKCMYYYMDIGHPWKAVRIGEKILLLQKEGNERPLSRINSLLNLGAALECAGKHERAMNYYESALDTMKQSKCMEPVKAADIYNEIGAAAQSLQRYSRAYAAYKEALNILKRAPGSNGELEGTILNNMGQLMQETKHPEKALYYYMMALRCFLEYSNNDNPYIANTLDNIGSIWDMMEEYKKAAVFHMKGLWYRWKKGGLNSADTATSLHNLAMSWQSDKKMLKALIVECMAVLSLNCQEISVEDYPIYLCMGQILEFMHLKYASFRFYKQALKLLQKKEEIVSETIEICLIMATFFPGWESRFVSEKWLMKASDLLERKKNLYRKDYELKIAVLFSLERIYLHNGEISEAFKCLDNAEHILTCLPDQQSYREVYESIHEARAAINERRVL